MFWTREVTKQFSNTDSRLFVIRSNEIKIVLETDQQYLFNYVAIFQDNVLISYLCSLDVHGEKHEFVYLR